MLLGTVVSLLMVMSPLAAGCAQQPPTRLDAYLGPTLASERSGPARLTADAPTGMVLVTDDAAKDAAPALPESMQDELARIIESDLNVPLRLRVLHGIPRATVSPDGDASTVLQLARERRLPYVLVVILSSTDSRKLITLTPVASSYQTLGTELQNYALVEMALIDAMSERVLVRAEGRSRSTFAPGAGAPRRWRDVQSGGLDLSRHISSGDPVVEMRFDAANGAAEEAMMDFERTWQRMTQTAH